jgi:hypothetical protein
MVSWLTIDDVAALAEQLGDHANEGIADSATQIL